MEGGVLFGEALDPDWEPAREGARLSGLRTLGVWHDEAAESSVEPVWHESGPPMVRALRVTTRACDREWSTDFTATEYFADTAREVVRASLDEGRLAPDERVRYGVAAYPVEPAMRGAPLSGAPDARSDRFAAVHRPQPLAVRDRAFSDLAAGSLACGDHDPLDFEVVFPESVVTDICARTKAAGGRETGGILIGHICRDDARGDVGLEITAHIPARHTVGEADKLTFTSETWTDVRNAVALRKADELMLGWWHSHPAFTWCAKCPIERQRVCQLASGFLSADDKALHRSIFPTAFTQALVITNSAAGLDTRLFGWRNGVLKARGYRIRQAPPKGVPYGSHRPAPLKRGALRRENKNATPPTC
jgi:hypothetical protein